MIHAARQALTPAECESTIGLAPAEMAPAPVWGGSDYVVDPLMRRAAMTLLDRDSATSWLHDRLDALFAEAAEPLGVAVRPLEEPLQLVRYDVGGHFHWHSDAGLDLVGRRMLSLSVELSGPDEYDGGQLEIAPDLIGPRTSERGSATLFRSQSLHRVAPVTRGTRWAIVAWAGGTLL